MSSVEAVRLAVVERPDRDHLARVAGAADRAVAVPARVSGRADDHDPGVPQLLDRLHQRIDVRRLVDGMAERQVEDADAVRVLVLEHPLQPGEHARGAALPEAVEDADRDQARLRGDAGESAILRVRAVAHQDAGHVRSVPVGIDAARGREAGIVAPDQVDGSHEPGELGAAGDAGVHLRDRHSRALELALGLEGLGQAGGDPRSLHAEHRDRGVERHELDVRVLGELVDRAGRDSHGHPAGAMAASGASPELRDERALAGAGRALEAHDHVEARAAAHGFRPLVRGLAELRWTAPAATAVPGRCRRGRAHHEDQAEYECEPSRRACWCGCALLSGGLRKQRGCQPRARRRQLLELFGRSRDWSRGASACWARRRAAPEFWRAISLEVARALGLSAHPGRGGDAQERGCRPRVAGGRGLDLGQQARLDPLARVPLVPSALDQLFERARDRGPAWRAELSLGTLVTAGVAQLAAVGRLGQAQQVCCAASDAAAEPIGGQHELRVQPLPDGRQLPALGSEQGCDLHGERLA